ncbi:MAG: hypothetical protein LBU40_00560 [Methanobrevibacter sp.]|jgi:hypothetical protein|nr:hypothetical protein [Methanobrevibacter sp.]
MKQNKHLKTDSKGIISIEYLFLIFLTIIIIFSLLSFFQSVFESINSLEENVEGRILLKKISSNINEINSLDDGYMKELVLPNEISKSYYEIILKSNEIILETYNKKGISITFPINLANSQFQTINETKLYPGEKYLLKKVKNNNNLSSIYIQHLN